MGKLLMLALVGCAAVAAYNYHSGRGAFHLPGASTKALDTVSGKVENTVRDTVHTAAREARAEIKEVATSGLHSAVTRAGETVTEATLTSKIKAKMALDDLVKASDISVATDGSVVTLTGTVSSKDERRRAVRIATETNGVTKVVDHLRVR